MAVTNATLSGFALPTPEAVSVALAIQQPAVAKQVREILAVNDVDCVLQLDSVEPLGTEPAVEDANVFIVQAGKTRSEIIEAFERARTLVPARPLVGLWPDDQRREDRRALKAGVDGLLQQDQLEVALIPTLEAVSVGLTCFPRRLRGRAPGEALSSREKQVLGMLIMGFTNAEIGRRLYLAESTVKSHLSSAYLKLGVRSRKDAAALILDPDEGLGTAILAIQGGASEGRPRPSTSRHAG